MLKHALQFQLTINDYRTQILAVIVVALLIAFLVMPSVVVEAGKATAGSGNG